MLIGEDAEGNPVYDEEEVETARSMAIWDFWETMTAQQQALLALLSNPFFVGLLAAMGKLPNLPKDFFLKNVGGQLQTALPEATQLERSTGGMPDLDLLTASLQEGGSPLLPSAPGGLQFPQGTPTGPMLQRLTPDQLQGLAGSLAALGIPLDEFLRGVAGVTPSFPRAAPVFR